MPTVFWAKSTLFRFLLNPGGLFDMMKIEGFTMREIIPAIFSEVPWGAISAVIGVLSPIICAWITKRGIDKSTESAERIATHTAEAEIKKMELQWHREDALSSGTDLSEIAKAVAQYLDFQDENFLSKPISLVAAARISETGKLGACLDQLYSALMEKNFPEVAIAMDRLIRCKRDSS